MNDVLRMGKRIFTVSVVVTTITWSIGLAALLMPLAAGAATLTAGDLIKASQPAVYYYGADGKRYVFPNEKTYKTWYSDFSSVKKITDAELAAVAIGGNVTYKPGVKMVKITTDPKVYAVDAGGALRWVNSETVAGALYGGTWAKSVEDVPDAFFVNYKSGADIAQASDFVKATVTAAAVSINVDKGLASAGTGGTGALSFALADGNPAAASIVADATDGGQRRAPVMKLQFTAGSADVKVTTLKLKRGGISKDGDVDNVYLMDGKTVVAEAQSVSSGIATITAAPSLFTVSANSSKVYDVVMDVNKAMGSGSTINWSLASADVVSDAASVSGSAVGNTMTAAVVTDLGSLKLGSVNTYPSTVDPGVTGKEMWRLSFEAESQDILVTYAKFNNLGSSYDSDITNIKLMDGSTQLNGVVAVIKDKAVEFDMSGMTGGGYKILAGVSKQLTLVGDVVSGTSRTFRWSVQKQQDVRAKDLEYGVEAFVNNGTAATFAVIQAGAATSINTGSLSIGLSSTSPNTYISDGGTNLTLAKFNFKATGEDVKVTALTVLCTASTTTRDLVNTLVKLDGVQVGTTDATMECDATTDEATYSFGNSFIVPADGKEHTVEIAGDLTNSAWVTDDTVYVGFGGTATAQGKTSLTSITPTNLNGHILTLKGAAVSAIKNQSFTDRSSAQPTGVVNASNVKIASFIISGGAGEAADISQIVLRDVSDAYSVGDDFQNMVLKDSAGNQVGTTVATLNTTASTYTFTPASAIRILAGEQKAFDVFADVKGTVTNSGTAFGDLEVDTISATGVNTGTSANFGTSGNDATDVAMQNVYIALHGQLTVDESADTPVAQQMLLGSTGLSLAKFKLTADAAENIRVSEFTVADDTTSSFFNGGAKGATGTLKNLSLYNGSTLLASVAAFSDTNTSGVSQATFTGFNLTVPKNSNVVLEIKGDLASYADGGKPSSAHRLVVLADLKNLSTGVTNALVAVGAGSGITMSLNALDISGPTTGNTDSDVVGSKMDVVRAKLTLAHAADSPSGSSSKAAEQTVAKFLATNSANVGSYTVTIKNMNFSISSAGASTTNSTSRLKVYKDSISTANQLASSLFAGASGPADQNFVDSTIVAGDFTDVEVASGSSRTIVVTIGTDNVALSANDTLSVGIAVAGDIQWNDGNEYGNPGNTATVDYYTVDTLPLTGKTLVY